MQVLAFLVPKTKIKTNIFVTGAIMFLIFSSLPFSFNLAIKYFIYGAVVVILFSAVTWGVNLKLHKHVRYSSKDELSSGNKINASIAVSALVLAWLISYILKQYSSISHLYWISLTILVVIQGAQQKNIHTAMKRILINFIGAIAIILLFNYVIPTGFWVNFILLTAFLFLIFALGFSYVWRTLFIEMFVLGFTHVLGSYHVFIALDRIILTTIGGGLVISNNHLFLFPF